MSVCAVVLAAGAGTRLGGCPKALLRREGEYLVERAVRVAATGGCAGAVVVLGCEADRVAAAAGLGGARIVVNAEWETGMGSSLRAGLSAAEGDAALVLLVDQPFVGADAVRAVAGACDGGASLAMAAYGRGRGHPVLLGRERWPGVAALARGDRGARDYLAAHQHELTLVPCDGLADPADVDVPGDLARYGVELP